MAPLFSWLSRWSGTKVVSAASLHKLGMNGDSEWALLTARDTLLSMTTRPRDSSATLVTPLCFWRSFDTASAGIMSPVPGVTKQSTWYLSWPSSRSPGTVTRVSVTPELKSVTWVTDTPDTSLNSTVTESVLVFPDIFSLYTLASSAPLDTLITNWLNPLSTEAVIMNVVKNMMFSLSIVTLASLHLFLSGNQWRVCLHVLVVINWW